MSSSHNLIDASPLEDVREDQRGVACVSDPEAPGSDDEIQQQQATKQTLLGPNLCIKTSG